MNDGKSCYETLERFITTFLKTLGKGVDKGEEK